jgi:hypothetical protein
MLKPDGRPGSQPFAPESPPKTQSAIPENAVSRSVWLRDGLSADDALLVLICVASDVIEQRPCDARLPSMRRQLNGLRSLIAR